MHKMIRALVLISISTSLISGCASSKSKVFGDDMPSMKTIHDNKFQQADTEQLPHSERDIQALAPASESGISVVAESNVEHVRVPSSKRCGASGARVFDLF